MKKLIIPFVLIIAAFSSCDKIETPIQNSTVIDNDSTVTVLKRRVLIEEFTGQLCTSCPDGAREIERLVDVYGDQVIPISIHSGAFATNGPDAAIFVTPDGTDYNTTFGVSSYPAGIVSRINAGTIYGRSQWEAEYTALAGDAPYADIIITNTYNASTREVTINVESEWLIDGDNGVNYKLQVYIIEDHIIAEQLDNGVNMPNYDHKHVLRGAVNTSWGTAIPITLTGTTDSQSFNYTLDAAWKEADCEVIAFIYKEGPDYEVMQANRAHIE